MVYDLIVVGGGAAGFYGAIQTAEMNPELSILIVEKSTKLLSKVRVSGGGRCNVTHHCYDAIKLSQHYPRGEKSLRLVFKRYNVKDTVAWFASRNVQLKTENDGRMFPVTDRSETIIECFLSEARRLNIRIETGFEVMSVNRLNDNFQVVGLSGAAFLGSRVLIATGGSPKPAAYSFIRNLGHTIQAPIPSLFTFNDSGKTFTDLMGISVPRAEVRIAKTKFKQVGPVLITHWGLSGPAVIKLSAWAAEYLHSVKYDFRILVSWIGEVKEEVIRDFLLSQKASRGKLKIWNNALFDLPHRLWVRLCEMSEIPDEKIWAEISNRSVNKLTEHLIKCPFRINGKTTFKDEFVTCGGVSLQEIDLSTMESKKAGGVFFAGEVLNIDGETGGFNFQAAWSSAFLAAKAICSGPFVSKN